MENIYVTTTAVVDLLETAHKLMQNICNFENSERNRDLLSVITETVESVNRIISEPRTSSDQLSIYTDGACSGNPGPGGWGIVAFNGNNVIRRNESYRHTTNNRMELMAAIAALDYAIGNTEKKQVEIISDSKYVTDAINKGWLDSWAKNEFSRPLNPDLWKQLFIRLKQAKTLHEVTFTWVKGHAGNKLNEEADRLAVEASLGLFKHQHEILNDKYYEENN